MVLIPKDKGEYICVGLVETFWKVCTSILNAWLRSSIVLHDVLHVFKQGKGTGTAIVEAKLEQPLARVFHETLFQFFIDVTKSYNSLDIWRYI